MDQLTQQLKNGRVAVTEVPLPKSAPGLVTVRNCYSLISPGTEGATARAARKGLIGKARERPEQARQVLETLKKQGALQTYREVMKKLEAYSPLGYSTSGVVIETGEEVVEFHPGDLAACAGAGYASHAEIIAVPTSLCVKLPDGADMKAAAYNTPGAIAMQGVRQADLHLGESCVVIGLGLIGQMTCLILRAAGIHVVGVDIDASAVDAAEQHCVDLALRRSEAGIEDEIWRFTGGLGADAVVITAASSSLDPINFAGSVVRRRGRVVVVGDVPTGFNRENYYMKELELRMSCSYGPGRYDAAYEEKNIDYPPAYVRWTEKRNMQAFQQLICSGKINIDYLTTHEFPLKEAVAAYDLIVEKSSPYLGIIIRYDHEKPLGRERVKVAVSQDSKRTPCKVALAFIGAGNYAQGQLLPNLPLNDPEISLKAVLTRSGTTSRRVAERYGFEFCTSNEADIFENDAINTVFIATRHDTHCTYVKKALESGKHVFVEKPLAINRKELSEVRSILSRSGPAAGGNGGRDDPLQLMVGFNRRFAPLALLLKQHLGHGPKAIVYRVNAGRVPPDSWVQDREVGGGRIVGEVCHFIDFMMFLTRSMPVRVFAQSMAEPFCCHDTLLLNLGFEDGSVGTVCYFSNGAKSPAKEYVEIYDAGRTAVLDDFRELTIYGPGRPLHKKTHARNKGQENMLKAFLDALKTGINIPVPAHGAIKVTEATMAAVDSLRCRIAIEL